MTFNEKIKQLPVWGKVRVLRRWTDEQSVEGVITANGGLVRVELEGSATDVMYFMGNRQFNPKTNKFGNGMLLVD